MNESNFESTNVENFINWLGEKPSGVGCTFEGQEISLVPRGLIFR